MSIVKSPKEYLSLLIYYLNNDSKILENINNEELKETEIDVLSDNLFIHLYHNFLYFYKLNKKTNISTEEQEYFYKEITNIFNIIHESNPDLFFKNDFIKSIMIYIIYSFKAPIKLNLENILKIFLSFSNILESISNEKMKEEVNNFEKDIFETVISLINKYIMDFLNEELHIENQYNFNDIIKYLIPYKDELPFYLLAFIDYNNQTTQKKYIIIKIYKYAKLINPFKSNIIFSNLFQGYLLYEILYYKNDFKIYFKKFNTIRINRINNFHAKLILDLSIKLLESKSQIDFEEKLKKVNIDLKPEEPKILDIFDNLDEYYQNLYEQLIYYLLKYKQDPKKLICYILNNNISRILWLNFNKLLLLNLNENDIGQNKIKIIFYFITNLFNPNIDYSSLEFREDAIPILFSQCFNSIELLINQEIYSIIDKDYSKFYIKTSKENEFTQMFINSLNEELLNNPKINSLDKEEREGFELENIKKCNKYLPFPLLQDYLQKSNLDFNIKNSSISKGLLKFYRNCFSDLEDDGKKIFIERIKNINASATYGNVQDIEKILNDPEFYNLINRIMTSCVMKDAYTRINNLYISDGKFENNEDIIKSMLDKEKNSNIENNNKINNNNLLYYYEQFCNSLKENKFKYNNLFIIMGLPETIKGFTFRFLKIVINSEGIKLKYNNYKNKVILLKAYLIFVIIHEQNYYIKRWKNTNINNNLANPPKINGCAEGGKQLIKLLFGDELIRQYLNVEQAEYILNIKNWAKQSVSEFKEDFLEIGRAHKNEESIIYLSSENESICDHSKLYA